MTDTKNRDREDKVASCFGQGIDPHESVEDYGDLDDDYNANEQAQSFEHTEIDDNTRDYVIYRKDD
jgi:hypothetical protein